MHKKNDAPSLRLEARRDWRTQMSNEQQTPSNETNQEEIPSYPFPFADHSLDLPKEYDQLRQKCPVARVH